MYIRDMFAEDINRQINGVIKVDQEAGNIIEQEVKEYVITKELKKHFINFFNFYSDSFDAPTADVGVWISGFFGSGKSHFLKMLSYILENKPVCETTAVEMFRNKFEDDPATFMLIDKATRGTTETILFNIDIEGSINKDRTAVLRVFAKMFYNHLGFFGENLKVAMLEQYIDQLGKTNEFRRVFEEKKGKPWIEQRKAFAFNGKFIIPTLMEVLDISEDDAKRWFNDKSAVDFSISRLVEDIKAYVNSKPTDFRLLFMVDEVGQYVGTDTDMLLNLQSLIEKIGSECNGKVWIMCTGQEAIDEIIKVRADEFSRIQARFKTRLSLSSSSVDEVIQKRILKKKPEVENKLESLYDQTDSILRNLFTFTDSILDIKGYSGPEEFAINFPFVPYQFIIMQKVFAEIRKHGNSGKHLSGGERSMLSGFQEATQKIQLEDEYALVPFFRFYDTVHSFLDGSIRRVIERCDKAAESNLGIEPQDVDVLKLLYLIRYVDDIPANVDNIVILMSDDIRTDKIMLREKVCESLNRLVSQNYIGRTADIYNFLTDEEQDIQREINSTNVDTSSIVEEIGRRLFADIYTTKKYRYGKYDFDFDKMVDGVTVGVTTGGMKVRFITAATDATEKSDLHLRAYSGGQAIIVLGDTPYFESLENAMKIRKYVKQRNVSQLPKSVQDIIHSHQEQANKYETDAVRQLKDAIIDAKYFVDNESIEIKSGDVKSRIDQALEYLVAHVYSELDLITKNAETDADILGVLDGSALGLHETEPNRDAAAKIEEFLCIQDQSNLPTSMLDIQGKYQKIPFGWREIDIAAVVALLIHEQKVTIKYGGAIIQPDNPKLPDMLRKRTEIAKTGISMRKSVNAIKIKQVRKIIREYFEIMDVPNDEDGLVSKIIGLFEKQEEHYKALDINYAKCEYYPDHDKVSKSISLMNDILSQKSDNIALIERIIKKEGELFSLQESMQNVEGFFANQVQVFDLALKMEEQLKHDRNYISHEAEANQALNEIRKITRTSEGFDYKKIPQLNTLMTTVKEGHNRLLDEKRKEVLDIVTQCMVSIQNASNGEYKCKNIVESADDFYADKKKSINQLEVLALIDGLVPQMLQYQTRTIEGINSVLKPPAPNPEPKHSGEKPITPKKIIKPYNRQIVFPASQLESEDAIDEYVENMRSYLKQLLNGCDGIKLK